MKTIVLVCGGRDYQDFDRILEMLAMLDHSNTIVVNGGAPGADSLARRAAHVLRMPCHTYEAAWTRYGRSAGPRRNARMLALEHPNVVLAFPGGRGTANMIEQAERAGIEVMRVPV